MQLRESDMPEEVEWVQYFHPKNTLQMLGLRRGMVFADLGCGYGTFTIPAAEIVGRKGKVYAVDLDPGMVGRVLAKSKKLGNVRAIVGDITSPASTYVKLPPHQVDFVLLANVIHGTRNKVALLKSIARILSPNGRIVVLNWNVAKTPRGPPMKMRPTPEQTINYLKRAGYDAPHVVKVLPHHYGVVAQT